MCWQPFTGRVISDTNPHLNADKFVEWFTVDRAGQNLHFVKFEREGVRKIGIQCALFFFLFIIHGQSKSLDTQRTRRGLQI